MRRWGIDTGDSLVNTVFDIQPGQYTSAGIGVKDLLGCVLA
jgi:hypothetical protein